MPVIVDNRTSRAVVVSSANATAIVQNRPSTLSVSDQRTAQGVVSQPSMLQVSSPGVQGPAGTPGVSGAGLLPPINFAFGDATPDVVLTLAETSEITSVSLQIEEAFDGIGAQIQLGTTANPNLLLAADQNNPADGGGVYETAPRVELAASTQVILRITPGTGATTGRGQFVVSAVPTT